MYVLQDEIVWATTWLHTKPQTRSSYYWNYVTNNVPKLKIELTFFLLRYILIFYFCLQQNKRNWICFYSLQWTLPPMLVYFSHMRISFCVPYILPESPTRSVQISPGILMATNEIILYRYSINMKFIIICEYMQVDSFSNPEEVGYNMQHRFRFSWLFMLVIWIISTQL